MRWLKQLFSRRRRYSDLSVSIREHVKEKIEELMEGGASREEATRTARREFGNVTLVEERSREVWQWLILESVWADAKFAWRQLAKSPRFTIAAIITLALGIGATATVYSVVHAVLIDPYPYKGADRMVHLHLYDKEPFPNDLALTGPQFAQFQKSPVLDGSIAEDSFSMALTGENLPQQIQGGKISPNAFQYFGVPALLGREFTFSDNPEVAVLSYRFWKSHYQSRPDIIGKSIQIDHESYTILGILPQRFAWTSSDVYLPLQYSPDPHRMANVFARLKAGVSYHAAERALQPMLDAFAKETPDNFPQKFKVHLVRINDIAIGRFSGVLVILFIAVSFLLVLACANVAILLLARGEARQAEIALRKTLGASPFRILRQLLTEASVLSISGGFFGVLLAFAGIRLVKHYLPQSTFPAEAEILLNIPVLAFSTGVSMLTGIAAGLWPAIRVSRAHLRQTTDAGSSRLTRQKDMRRGHMALLSCQVALTVLLLACSGATLRKLSQLIHADLGYDPHNLISINLTLRDGAYSNWAKRINYYEEIRKKISSDPDVISAAIAENNLPPSMLGIASFSILGSQSGSKGHILPQGVSPQYFSTLRIPLLHGRAWSNSEMEHASHTALINEAMQRRYWPHSDPIGQTIVLNNGVVTGNVWTLVAPGNDGRFQIIGVVGDSPNRGLDDQISPEVYLPYTMTPYDWFNLMIRTRGDSSNLLHTIKEQVHDIDSNQAVGDISTATDMLESNSLGRERFVAGLFTAFAFLGLAFAASGLYSILSYLVAQRTKEFGVRMALGAKRRHIVRLVTESSFIAVLVGVGIGLLADFALSQAFAHWTNGNTRNPGMLGVIAVILFIVTGFSSIVPAWLAASIVPMKALRTE